MTKKTFDQMSMTGRELKDMQKVTDGPDDPTQVSALFWIAKRREDKTFTFEQALDASLAEMTEYLGLDNPLTNS
jgi:deferrochelatase/peroxidase EfeB